MRLAIHIVGYTCLAVAVVIGISPWYFGHRDRYIGKRRRKG